MLKKPDEDVVHAGSRYIGRHRRFVASCAVALLCTAPQASADEKTERPAASQSSQPLVRPPVAPLPKPPSKTLPPPTQEQLQIIDQLLERLRSGDTVSREVALSEVANVDDSLLPAIQARLDEEAEGADRKRMKRLLLDIRSEVRDAIKKEMQQSGQKGEVETPDYLQMVVSNPKPDSKVWPTLVNVLALSRMCLHLGTTEAVRVLIHVYVRFDFLRIDTQLQLRKMGDKAVPALLEATRHPARKVSDWASRQLDFIGKAIPGEAVQVEDAAVLADVLRAYGRIKDPDAARMVISFSNSERAQIREAARQSVVMFGEIAGWQLRDAYENMVGKRPPREWAWDRTARELFNEFDRMRLMEVYSHYQQGLEAREQGDLPAMRKAFDRVLLRNPDFEPRDEILDGYLAYVDRHFDDDDDDDDAVSDTLRRVRRLATNEQTRAQAESLLLTRQARKLLERDVADQSLLRRALELDPQNQRAQKLFDDMELEPVTERTSFMRILWPAVLFGLALLSLAFILIRRRSASKAS